MMKTTITILILAVFMANLIAQVPDKMSYQAVVRNSTNNLVTSQAVGMQISILHGTADGTAVYLETQTPTSNVNGLVSIEIGTGTTSDDFSSIDWADGPYFIKTETDPAGGTNYTITGTSQMLSVPYALYAKTAESITETDPVFTASQAHNITAADITNLSNLSGTNSGDQDISGIATNAQAIIDTESEIREDIPDVSGLATKANVLELNNTTAFTPDADYEPATKKYVDDHAPVTYSVGDHAQGGIVFWVDETGQHGLVAAESDQSTGIQWYNGTNTITCATKSNGIGGGILNTERIIVNQGLGDYAAELCSGYSTGPYGDWFLPSIAELYQLYLQRDVVGGFAGARYWSSTGCSTSTARCIHFDLTGEQTCQNKDHTYFVRAIRAF